jgi:dUTP pyrophosphatase
MVKIKVKKIREDAIIPVYAHEGDAGMDLFSVEKYLLKPMERCLVSTGVKFEIPLGYEIQIRPRSGLALKKGISMPNSPGTIDSGYRGEIEVIIINHGNEDFEINPGDRIAQIILNKVENIEIEEADELEGSSRGEGGFGSTGLR